MKKLILKNLVFAVSGMVLLLPVSDAKNTKLTKIKKKACDSMIKKEKKNYAKYMRLIHTNTAKAINAHERYLDEFQDSLSNEDRLAASKLSKDVKIILDSDLSDSKKTELINKLTEKFYTQIRSAEEELRNRAEKIKCGEVETMIGSSLSLYPKYIDQYLSKLDRNVDELFTESFDWIKNGQSKSSDRFTYLPKGKLKNPICVKRHDRNDEFVPEIFRFTPEYLREARVLKIGSDNLQPEAVVCTRITKKKYGLRSCTSLNLVTGKRKGETVFSSLKLPRENIFLNAVDHTPYYLADEENWMDDLLKEKSDVCHNYYAENKKDYRSKVSKVHTRTRVSKIH